MVSKVSKRLNLVILLISIILIVIFYVTFFSFKENTSKPNLIINNLSKEKELKHMEAQPGINITITFIHSVQKKEFKEIYYINDNYDLILISTTYEDGILDDNYATTNRKTKDAEGITVVNLDEIKEKVIFRLGSVSQPELYIDNTLFPLSGKNIDTGDLISIKIDD